MGVLEDAPRTRTGSADRAAWTLASALGLAAGVPAGIAVAAPLEVVVGAMLVTPLMLGCVGALLGFSQWVALRRRLERAGLWIAVTAVGLGLGLTAAVVLVEQLGHFITGAPVRMSTSGMAGLLVAFVTIGVIAGGANGMAQSFYLRRRGASAAGWVGRNVLGLTGGFLGGFALASVTAGGVTNPAGLVIFLAVSGLVFGLVTAAALPSIEPGSPTAGRGDGPPD